MMNEINFTLFRCGIFGIAIFIYMMYWIFGTLRELPQDIATLHDRYRQKDWFEFRAHAAVTGFYWAVSLLSILFLYSAFTLPKADYG